MSRWTEADIKKMNPVSKASFERQSKKVSHTYLGQSVWLQNPNITANMTEENPRDGRPWFRKEVQDLLKGLGYDFYHTENSVKSRSGFPDLVIWHEARKISAFFAELKSNKGSLTMDQKIMHQTLRGAGSTVHIWRPKDWSEIVTTLWPS